MGKINPFMNDIAMPSLSIACLDACKGSAIRLSEHVLSKSVELRELRVEAWDWAHRIVNLLVCAFTEADGMFELVFPAETLRVFSGDQRPTLFFRVFHGPTFLADTEMLPEWDLDESTSSPVTLDLPIVSPDESRLTPAPFTVRGHLRNPAGTPLVGLLVRAFDRNLRDRETERLLHGITDAVGRDSLAYAVEDLGRAGKHLVDLVLRVFDAGGGLQSSPDFDLHTSRLDESLASAGEGTSRDLSDIAEHQLRHAQVQRIFKPIPRYRDRRAPLDIH